MIIKKFSLLFVLSLLFLFIFQSCDKGKNIPDVSDITIDLDLKRFEQDLFALDTNTIETGLIEIQNKYPEFSAIYFNQILKVNDPRYAPQGQNAYLKGFIAHPALTKLEDTIQIIYKNTDKIKGEFEQAFQFLKYYYPETPTPSVTTFLSEYSVAAFIFGENDLAVGLDFFLGSDYPYKKYNPNNDAFSQYLTRTFNETHLVAKTLRPLAEDLVGPQQGNKLLDYMIHNGKQLYFLEQILPYASDTILMEYTQEKMDWVKNNEREIYAYFLEKELLYSTEYRDFNKLVNPSPVGNTDMPKEAPGQTANYIGWEIIKAFMARNTEVTLPQLMKLEDHQMILDKSRYKPARR